MLVVIINLAKNIIFKNYFGKEKHTLEYLLINAALDTEEDLSMDGHSVQSKLFPSGHRLIISHRNEEKIPKKFIELIDQIFQEEMMNPYVNDSISLSSEFTEKVVDAFNRTILKVNFSI